MSEQQDGLHGWMRTVVVIAALMTITDTVYDFIKGFINYQSTKIEMKP